MSLALPLTLIQLMMVIVRMPLTSNESCREVVPRAEWKANPPRAVEMIPELPVPFVVVHHTYIPPACNTTALCCGAMRSMQRYHQDGHRWNDIGYNFAIGGDGMVYEGRGWDVVGAHAPFYNNKSIGITLIGDYRFELPSDEMLNSTRLLIECGVARGSIRRDYKLLGHRQVRATECPGQALYDEIQTWPQWDPLINIIPRT